MPFDLQPIDVLLLVILALAALSGWRRGFAMVLLGYLGLLVGLALGAWAATQAGLLVSDDSSVRRLLTAIVVFFLVAAACHAVGNLLGIKVRSLLGGRRTDPAHDLALLSVPDLSVRPLRLATAAARRGQEAVVIGYPSGGGQKFIGAQI